jgi:hypothetical protein
MFRRTLYAALMLSAAFAGCSAAHAENRLALVIGESAYRAVTPLPNPANDVRAMSKLLTDSGFDVTAAIDLSQRDLNQEVGDFAAKVAAKGADTVALVFYAGHGLQIDGENYLVPVDVDPKREADIPLQAVRLNDVLNTLNSVPSKMRILLLDACRNNPFPAISGSTGHGLALVDANTGAPGTFLSYSTSPGAEAEDGNGDDSPYTTALLAAAREPGVPIEEAFKRVRVAVNKATDGRQTPWESSSLTEDFRFITTTDPSAANAGPMPSPVKRSVEDWKRGLQGKPVQVAHDMVVADNTLEGYEAFDALYGQSPFTAQTREWIVREQRMVAWNDAVLVNTAAGYRSFLAQYPDSDLTATAQKLIERLRYRPNVMSALALATPANAPIGNCTAPSTPAPALKKADVTPAPSHEPQPTVVVKKVEVTPPRREIDPPVHVNTYPARSRPVVDEPVYRGPMRPVYGPPVYGRPMYGPVGMRMGWAGGFGGGFRGPMGFGRMRRF